MNSENIAHNSPAIENEVVFDLGRIVGDIWQGFLRFWALGLALLVVGVAACVLYVQLTYTPVYDAYASFVVQESLTSSQSTTDYSAASRISTTFQTILKTGVLRSVVELELGIEELESTVTTSSIANTNIVTIHVQDEDPAMALAVLNSLMTNYPIVAEYILGATQLSIVDESGLPEKPTEPKSLAKAALLGAVGGLGLFALFLLVYAMTRKTLVSVHDLQAPTHLSYITGIPKVQVKKRTRQKKMGFLIYRNNQDPAFLEAFRVFSNAIEKDAQHAKSRRGAHQVYMLTSTTSDEDKTVTAMNLARMLAHRDYKVLFMNLNLHKSAVEIAATKTTLPHNLGTVLLGESTLAESVQKIGRKSTFDLLDTVTADDSQALSVLSSGQLSKLIKAARKQYDFIILDTSPLSLYADATIVASSYADAAILVTKQEVTAVPLAVKAAEQLKETGVHMAGFVMNGVSRDSGRYGYGQGYGNSYYGGYYYKTDYQGRYNYEKV